MTGLYRRCPGCRQPVGMEDRICRQCGTQLYILCPSCGRETFIQSNCRYCRLSLYAVCPNKDCKRTQLISPNGRCRICGTHMTGTEPEA